ncbi:hypothetical protein Ahy_B02g061502 isoform H [Arachis hypogaea]|uniref:Uncharacterized protein n=2 Tax=Arachis hypogaea TaxID=3818 RepID=A0A445AL43_ARAHY|nr:hypothetical protein Ahy_B02g061502 isoform H [Arachis hypogaea]
MLAEKGHWELMPRFSRSRRCSTLLNSRNQVETHWNTKSCYNKKLGLHLRTLFGTGKEKNHKECCRYSNKIIHNLPNQM